ncbi:MAG: response regulator [Deltaproteobacteria bacterium]|nr:response regulator [Deltaproteobacteria bacterium]
MPKCFQILLVDDEKFILRSLGRLLAADDREIHLAEDGAQALELLARHPIDLVLSDHRMPDMTGLELMVEVCRLYPRTIRMILTGYADQQVAIEAINRGEVYRFLTKPWDDQALLATVEDALQRISVADLSQRKLEQQLNRVDLETVMALAETIELKDPYTKGHCSRVRDYSCRLARRLGLSESGMPDLIYGSLLHDCGKIGISEAILCSQGRLSAETKAQIKRHPLLGFELTRKISRLQKASLMIRQHHERWDGGGYPDGLVGEQILLEARIIAIADAFDAMTSDRPYHQAMNREKALAIVRAEGGRQFDPRLGEMFCQMLMEEENDKKGEGKVQIFTRNGGRQENIMLLSRDEGVLALLREQLYADQYRLWAAGDSVTAFKLMAGESPDLLIVDEQLADMSGFDFLRRLQDEEDRAIRLALVVRDNQSDLMAVISELEIYQFVPKPWEEKGLRHIVNQALEWRQMLLSMGSASGNYR